MFGLYEYQIVWFGRITIWLVKAIFLFKYTFQKVWKISYNLLNNYLLKDLIIFYLEIGLINCFNY